MFRQAGPAAAIVSSAMILAGCGANHNSIYRTTELESGKSIVVDAKQRLITSVEATGGPGLNRPKQIICAEPSPDVAQALSESISGALKVDVAGKGSGAASFSRSVSESVAQLGERLATVQLLRDGLYRACEAYANGAITGTVYSSIVSRYDDTMVTLLLGELAAGAYGRSGAAIGTAAAAAGQAGPGIDAEQAQEDVKQARVKRDTANEKLRKEKDKLAALESADSSDESEIKAQKKVVSDAEQDRDEAQNSYEEALTVLAMAGQAGAMSSARMAELIAVSAIESHKSDKRAETIALMQRKYLENINADAFFVSCMSSLDRIPVKENLKEYLDTAISGFEDLRLAMKEKNVKKQDVALNKLKTVRNGLVQANVNAGGSQWGGFCLAALPGILSSQGRILEAIIGEEEEKKGDRRFADAVERINAAIMELSKLDGSFEEALEQIKTKATNTMETTTSETSTTGEQGP